MSCVIEILYSILLKKFNESFSTFDESIFILTLLDEITVPTKTASADLRDVLILLFPIHEHANEKVVKKSITNSKCFFILFNI